MHFRERMGRLNRGSWADLGDWQDKKEGGAIAREPDNDFEMIGIPVGSTLALGVKEEATCVAVPLIPTTVVYADMSPILNQGTGKVLGYRSGPVAEWWNHEGEMLAAWIKRFEDDHFNCEYLYPQEGAAPPA